MLHSVMLYSVMLHSIMLHSIPNHCTPLKAQSFQIQYFNLKVTLITLLNEIKIHHIFNDYKKSSQNYKKIYRFLIKKLLMIS